MKMTDNQDKIQQAFDQPQRYLTGTVYNITIRMETVQDFVRGRGRVERILDIGCGDGSLSLQLLNPDTRITLLDRSEAMLRTAASRIPDSLKANVSIVNDNLLTTELPTDEFDLIICVGVLAYVIGLNRL